MLLMLKKLYKDEKGQALSEYGLILALIALAVIAAITTLGDNIKGLFDKVATEISGAGKGGGSGE